VSNVEIIKKTAASLLQPDRMGFFSCCRFLSELSILVAYRGGFFIEYFKCFFNNYKYILYFSNADAAPSVKPNYLLPEKY